MDPTAADLEGMIKHSSLEKMKLGLKMSNRPMSVSQPFRFYGQVKFPLQKSKETTWGSQLLILSLKILQTK